MFVSAEIKYDFNCPALCFCAHTPVPLERERERECVMELIHELQSRV
jgi:hypothetical protein